MWMPVHEEWHLFVLHRRQRGFLSASWRLASEDACKWGSSLTQPLMMFV